MKEHIHTFFIKLFNWEYWPAKLVYIPIMVYYVYLSIKARNFFYYSASNPAIETGGMFAESKWEVLQLIPSNFYPETILVPAGNGFEQVKSLIAQKGLQYPVIAKPDRGERGWMVKKIMNEAQLKAYAEKVKAEYLIQKYIDLPVELSVFYYRYPNEQMGRVSSVVIKEMLHVIGDGKSTVAQLIKQNPRALLQWKVLQKDIPELLDKIPAVNEKIELVAIGNHARGTKFLDGCYLIDEQLNKVFDDLSKQITGFYYGRYDIRCSSMEELKAGKGFQVMELNGAGAEPAHIYNPGFPLFKAYGILLRHMRVMNEISVLNHRQGVKYMTARDYLNMRNLEIDYRRRMEGNG